MSIIINKTDGTILTTLIDGTVDQTSDLTLIGRNFSGFGQYLNENFVKLLENFSSRSQPDKPLVGQLWYDTTEARLKVYTGLAGGWKSSSGTLVSENEPLTFTTGDLWIDTTERQLHFYDGSNLLLAGPIWKKSQGITGFIAETLFDPNGNPKHVLQMYVNDALMGMYSVESFDPTPAISGFTTLVQGFTPNSNITFTVDTTVSNALTLNGLASSQFLRSDVDTTAAGQLYVQNNNGITIGAVENVDLKIVGTTFIAENVIADGDFVIKTNKSSGYSYPFYAKANTERVGLFTNSPTATLDVNGGVRIRGDLTVEGSQVSLETTVLQVEDKNIEIAKVASPTDATADGAGITIKGTVDKTITYNNSTASFDISENVNLAAGKKIKIGGIEVVNGSALGSAITSAPGITSLGNLTQLTVGDMRLSTNLLEGLVLNQDIRINPNGGNILLLGTPRITGLADPLNPQDAATRAYAQNFAKTLPLSLTFIDNNLPPGTINSNIIKLLIDIANPASFANGKYAYVHVQSIDFVGSNVTRYLKRFVITAGAWVFDSDLTSSI